MRLKIALQSLQYGTINQQSQFFPPAFNDKVLLMYSGFVSLNRGIQGPPKPDFLAIFPTVYLCTLALVEFVLSLVLSLPCIFWLMFLCLCYSLPLGYFSFFLSIHFQVPLQIPSVMTCFCFFFWLTLSDLSSLLSLWCLFIACGCPLTLTRLPFQASFLNLAFECLSFLVNWIVKLLKLRGRGGQSFSIFFCVFHSLSLAWFLTKQFYLIN